MRCAARAAAALVAALLGACAHPQHNERLAAHRADAGYRVARAPSLGNADDLLLLVTFSGGGTRAAAFAYGVLEHLGATEVRSGAMTHRLLDEVDLISAVSGGSFTAAYYGLFGDRLFVDFEERFLRRDGTTILVEVAGAPFALGGKPAVMVMVRDITDRRRLEEQLAELEARLEEITQARGQVE